MNTPVNVLLIDDEPRNLDVLESILEAPGYRLLRATNAEDALRLLLTQPIAVLVLDIRMPGTSGLELAQLVKQRPATRHVPIIFLTAYYNEDEHVLQGYDVGAVDYLRKPCNPSILRSKVAVFADSFRNARALEAENLRRQLVEADLREAYAAMEDRVRERTAELEQANAALRRGEETLEQKVVEATTELRRKADQLRMMAAELTRAKEQERKRLAQVLHDGLQQLLVAARMRVVSLAGQAEQARQRDALEQVRAILEGAIQTSRSLTAELIPPILYDAGLVPALEWLARWTEEQHGVRVEVAVDAADEPPAEAERVLLFDAAREFLFNAVKHAATPTARLSLRGAEDGVVRLTVEDDGGGFDPAIVAAAGPGAGGLGLLCLRERVEFAGGRLEIASRPGAGARVTVSVPRVAGEVALAALPAAAELQAQVHSVPGDSIRVLLADDHKIVREGFRMVLTAQPGIEVVGEAADGQQAIDLARELAPDVVIMDVSMPRMNGVEATRRILKLFPAVRVIGLSMHQAEEMGESMLRAGAVAYLSKEGPTDALVAAIRRSDVRLPEAAPASPRPGDPGARCR